MQEGGSGNINEGPRMLPLLPEVIREIGKAESESIRSCVKLCQLLKSPSSANSEILSTFKQFQKNIYLLTKNFKDLNYHYYNICSKRPPQAILRQNMESRITGVKETIERLILLKNISSETVQRLISTQETLLPDRTRLENIEGNIQNNLNALLQLSDLHNRRR